MYPATQRFATYTALALQDLPFTGLGGDEEWELDAEREQLSKQHEEERARLQQMSAAVSHCPTIQLQLHVCRL